MDKTQEERRVKKRRKSIEDIQSQFARIRELANYAKSNYYQRVYGANGARGIAQRYIDNIESRMNRKGIGLNDPRRYTTKAPQYAYRYGKTASKGNSNGQSGAERP